MRETARPYAEEVAQLLRDRGLRVGLDVQAGDMRSRIKEATERKANYILVVGDREAAARQVSVRRRGSRDEERGVALDAMVERLVAERDSKQLPADFVRPAGAPTLMADA